MENVVFTQLSISEIKSVLKDCLREVLKEKTETKNVTTEIQTPYGDLNWLCSVHPKKPAKATVYSEICRNKFPNSLVFKPAGNKKLLFRKELVLDWIDQGCPGNYQKPNIKPED